MYLLHIENEIEGKAMLANEGLMRDLEEARREVENGGGTPLEEVLAADGSLVDPEPAD